MHVDHECRILMFQLHNHTCSYTLKHIHLSTLNVINLDVIIWGVKLLDNDIVCTKIHFKLINVTTSTTHCKNDISGIYYQSSTIYAWMETEVIDHKC
jgi:hypothetical protein